MFLHQDHSRVWNFEFWSADFAKVAADFAIVALATTAELFTKIVLPKGKEKWLKKRNVCASGMKLKYLKSLTSTR